MVPLGELARKFIIGTFLLFDHPSTINGAFIKFPISLDSKEVFMDIMNYTF
jgi:hypothetical protein